MTGKVMIGTSCPGIFFCGTANCLKSQQQQQQSEKGFIQQTHTHSFDKYKSEGCTKYLPRKGVNDQTSYYYPVGLKKSYSIDDLPTKQEFLDELEKEEEEEEAQES
ncbi:MAG TPA: hypothetical protein PK939_07995 [Bacteroidales bacterium]|nr:hypothetical protein [Bacteroidales bacterium]